MRNMIEAVLVVGIACGLGACRKPEPAPEPVAAEAATPAPQPQTGTVERTEPQEQTGTVERTTPPEK